MTTRDAGDHDAKVPGESVAGSLTFLLGKLGALATEGFAARLAPMGLRPRHCAVLELIAAAPRSQLELAHRIGVAPSVVVDMLDELEALEAIRRVPDPGDRRRRIIELTATGRTLKTHAARAAADVDAELLAALPAGNAGALRSSLGRIAAAHGLHF